MSHPIIITTATTSTITAVCPDASPRVAAFPALPCPDHALPLCQCRRSMPSPVSASHSHSRSRTPEVTQKHQPPSQSQSHSHSQPQPQSQQQSPPPSKSQEAKQHASVSSQKRRRDAMNGGDVGGSSVGREGGSRASTPVRQKKRRRVGASKSTAAKKTTTASTATTSTTTTTTTVNGQGTVTSSTVSGSMSTSASIPMPLPPSRPRQSETALRIDVIRLVHGRSRSRRIRLPFNWGASAAPFPQQTMMGDDGSSSNGGLTVIDAMCRITVAVKDGGRVMHCHSHRCTIETSKDPYAAHPLLRVRLDDPYKVDWGTLTGYEHVSRPPDVEDVGRRYKVTIEVESTASSAATWPPLRARDLVGSDGGSRSSSTTSSTTTGIVASNTPGATYTDGPCPHHHLLPSNEETTEGRLPPTPPPTVASGCPHWRLESVFTGFSRPLAAPLLLKHFSGKGDLVHQTDYETRVMGGTA